MDDKRTPKRILEWKPIGMRIRERPRKRWIVYIKEDMQIRGIRHWRTNVKKEQNERKSLRRLKPIVGCNASKRKKNSLRIRALQCHPFLSLLPFLTYFRHN
jgi:hypothetical protein